MLSCSFDVYGLSVLCVIVGVGICALAIVKDYMLKWLAILILVMGVFVYGYGYYAEGTQGSVLALIVRSLMSSAEMFIGGNDLIEVRGEAKEDPAYMTIFASVHILAVLISITAAAAALGARTKFWAKMTYTSFLGKKKKTYLFFGATEPAFLLAKDICMKKDQDARFIFIQMPKEKEGQGEGHAIHHLMGMVNYRRSILERIREIGNNAHLAIATRSFTEFDCPDFRYYDETANFGEKKNKDDFMNPNGFHRSFDIFRVMGLKNLRNILLRHSDGPISMFFLNEDADFNLYSLDVLCSDPYFEDKHHESKIIVYCQARRDNINLLEEHRFLQKRKLEVHIVDASYLSVFYLKNSLEHLPVSYVSHSKGRVTSAFNSLILGFGETGQDCLRFLYEYGSFVGENGERSPFHCTIMDKHMNEIQGTYLMQIPALADSSLVSFEQMDEGNPYFWNRLRQLIQNLNYVVISVGDDEENISLAIKLYEFASRERANHLNDFTIFVRSYNPSHERRMNSIAQHYNLKNDISKDNNKQGIVVFGELDEIYTFERISFEDENEERSKEVRDFYEEYRTLAGNEDWDWEERHRRLLEPSIMQNIPQLYRYRKLNRVESQDYANWMHIRTKLELLNLPSSSNKQDMSSLTAEQQNELLEMTQALVKICNRNGALKFENPGCNKAVWDSIVALCQTEHLRWVSAHEMMGYTYGKVSSDERDMRMMHDMMIPWEQLTDIAKLYDAQVLLATLVTHFPKLKSITC